MSTESNVFSQGGGGTNFEFETHTALLVAMIVGAVMPGTETDKITKYRQQSGSLGYHTDDLYLETANSSGVIGKALVQIKHGLIISEKNDVWEKVLVDLWKDFTNPALFDQAKDRLIIIKDDLTQKEKKHLQEICDWAKAKTDHTDFTQEVTRIDAKKEYYNQFKSILGRHGITPSEQQMHGLFKCLDVLEYDFGKFASGDRASFINLIELSKSSSTTLNAAEIWNQLVTYASGSDSKGGMLEFKTIPTRLTENFNTSYFPAIEKKIHAFSTKNIEIIDVIETKIGSVELPRTKLTDAAKEGLAKSQFTILSGEPGSGKSAMAKKLTGPFNGHILVFKADELFDTSLTDLLHRKGIDLSVREFFNHFPLDGAHLIYVDALEKLLEGNGTAFQHLLKELKKHPDIKLLASCRTSNFHLLEIKYFSDIPFQRIDIDFLSDEELAEIVHQLPELKAVVDNSRLASLVRVPKYLDYACRAIKTSGKNFSSASSPEFMQDLWEIIVENKLEGYTGGMSEKRRNAFIAIAVNRAKSMKAFVPAPTGCDPEALELLFKENVVVKSADGNYAPAHDVLEDWALLRYAERSYSSHNSDQLAFFTSLGTEPAMRRAYRLWVQDALSSQDAGKLRFLNGTLEESGVEQFWKDELLVSVLKSDNCDAFFAGKDDQLKEDDWGLLKKIIILLETACRENVRNSWEDRYYVPTGKGWHVITKFIHDYFSDLPETMYLRILRLLEDYAKLLEAGKEGSMAIREAGLISLSLLGYFKKKQTYYYEDKTVLRCLKLAYEFSAGIKEELTEFFDKATALIDEDDREGKWIETRYYKQIIRSALDGISTGQLPKNYPDQLIAWAQHKWHYREQKRKPGDYRSFSSPSPEEEISLSFGLYHPRADDGTPSANRTFIYKMLRANPEKAIDFIIEFTNEAAEQFISSQQFERNPDTIYPIELPDGTIHEVRGISSFWNSYRGYSGPIPHLIESMMMALERYLVELGNQGEAARIPFQAALEKLFTGSRSLFITGVLSSVCQAHPELAGKWVLPLFTNMDFIFLDISRYTHDSIDHSLGMDDDHDRERADANKWKHRKAYHPGLKGLIMEQTLYEQELGPQIFAILDKHRGALKDGELDLERHLDDMDFRKYRVREVITDEDGTKKALMTPEYSEEVAKQHAEDMKKMPFSLDDMRDNNWLRSVADDPLKKDLEKWRIVYERYKAMTSFIWNKHAPGSLASIGVTLHWNELSTEEQAWCIERILTMMKELIVDDSDGLRSNPLDKEPVLLGFAVLLSRQLAEPELQRAEELLFGLLNDFPSNDQYYLNFLKDFRAVWRHKRGFAKNWWYGLIELASLHKSRPHYHDGEEEQAAYEEKQQQVFTQIRTGLPSMDVSTICFDTHNSGVLANAIRMLPGKGIDNEGIDFIIRMLQQYLAYNKTQDRFNRQDNDSGIAINIKFSLQEKIADIIINADDPQANRLFDYFLDLATDPDMLYMSLSNGEDTYSFITSVFERLFSEAENTAVLSEPEKLELYGRFYQKWVHFDEYLTKKGSAVFSNYLLMDTKWKEGTRVWNPLKGKETFLTSMIEKYGDRNPSAVINLLTYPANELLMPKAISVLVGILKKTETLTPFLTFPHIEKLVHRAYENHLQEIINDQAMLQDYLWLLDQLIASGSSDAYWIREFMISFSRPH